MTGDFNPINLCSCREMLQDETRISQGSQMFHPDLFLPDDILSECRLLLAFNKIPFPRANERETRRKEKQ